MNQGIYSNFSPVNRNLGQNITKLYTIEIYSSTTWRAPTDGILELLVFGAGGSGGISGGDTTHEPRAQGGCGGGTAYKKFKVKSGDSYEIIIGAGGIARTTGSFYNNINGMAGGTTTVTGRNCSIVIPGGLGGIAYLTTVGPIPKLQRSQPTGGDINIPGGVSGSINFSSYVPGKAYATGGAGVSLFSEYPDSGSILVRQEFSNPGSVTGGAGMFGSGSITTTSGTDTGGGGAYGPSSDNNSVGGSGSQVGASQLIDNTINVFNNQIPIFESGSAGSQGSNTSDRIIRYGAGTGGVTASFNYATNIQVRSGATLLGGSGGSAGVVQTPQGSSHVSGIVRYVGGSGGVAQIDGAGSGFCAITSNAGGRGLAFLSFYIEK